MLLFYVRHGDPVYDPDSLTPLGSRQAEAVAKRLALHGIDKIFASTSQRAVDTARPTSELTKKPIIQLDFCNEKYVWDEFAFPNSEGRKKWAIDNDLVRWSFVDKEIAAMGEKWYDHPMYTSYAFQAGMERIHRETDGFLLSLGFRHDREKGVYEVVQPNDDRVALFAHEGFGGCFLSSLLDIPYPQFASRFSMGHTGVTVIDFGNTSGMTIPKILTYANDGHLYREGVPKNCSHRAVY